MHFYTLNFWKIITKSKRLIVKVYKCALISITIFYILFKYFHYFSLVYIEILFVPLFSVFLVPFDAKKKLEVNSHT